VIQYPENDQKTIHTHSDNLLMAFKPAIPKLPEGTLKTYSNRLDEILGIITFM